MLFLLLGGVGATALLQGFWAMPGDLPSPRKEMDCGGGDKGPLPTMPQAPCNRTICRVCVRACVCGAHLDGLSETPDSPIPDGGDQVGE